MKHFPSCLPIVFARTVVLVALSALVARGQQAPAAYHLLDSCSRAWPDAPSGLRVSTDTEQARLGQSALRFDYRMDSATLEMPRQEEAIPIPEAGRLTIRVKGDGSGHRLQFRTGHAEVVLEGQRHLRGHRRDLLAPVTLDLDDWREFSFDVAPPAGRVMWLDGFRLQRVGEEKVEGHFLIDDITLTPASGSVASQVRFGMLGPMVREWDPEWLFLFEGRHFGAQAAQAEARLRVVDYHDNLVLERSVTLNMAPGEVSERLLRIAPDNLEVFLPPFRVSAQVLSSDLPDLRADTSQTLVMGNSYLLFEDFGDVYGRWFVSGMPFNMGPNNDIFGETHRAWALPQTNVCIDRVTREPGDGVDAPPGRFALRAAFNGAAMVYNGIHRYLPGDAYRMGVWIHGDGSGAQVQAVILDFAAAGSTFYTANRNWNTRHLATLDFTGWRYVEVPLPGNGIGPHTARGSTRDVDFPLDLVSFAILPTGTQPTGEVRFGPVFLHTQQAVSAPDPVRPGHDESNGGALSLQLGYDDADNDWQSGGVAWATVRNGWRSRGERNVRMSWSLLDRDGELVARGSEAMTLAPMQHRLVRLDLAAHAAVIAPRSGPLRLEVVADDASQGVNITRQLILAKPDSEVLFADFERERDYFGLGGGELGVDQKAGAVIAGTTDAQRHGGGRSLAIEWKPERPAFVAIDPALPGIPVEVSLWVHGDGSGVLFYPLIGSQAGVLTGHGPDWNLFLPRIKRRDGDDGPPATAVTIDWEGWREVTFRLPPIPHDWDRANLVHPFIPSYPLGLHLAVVPRGAGGGGVLYVDDIKVTTHLPPGQRIALEWDRPAAGNVAAPGTPLRVSLANHERAGAPRAVTVAGGVYDWRSRRVAGSDDARLVLAPGERRELALTDALPTGAFALHVDMTDGEGAPLARIREDLLVFDPDTLLGKDGFAALAEPDRLRVPVDARFTLARHDWDWVEFHPGNVQAHTLLRMADELRRGGRAPWMLLGYSAFWSAGAGFDSMLAGTLSRYENQVTGRRDWGNAVDIMMAPERLDDWNNYTRELFRTAGPHVDGWMLWDTPDSSGALGIPAPRFAEMIRMAEHWRRRYAPEVPMVLGGLSRATAIPYLDGLREAGAFGHFTGVNLRLDAGSISPEDGRILEFIEDVNLALHMDGGEGREILLTDLDWAVETEGRGLGPFDQAAWLSRASLLLAGLGIDPPVTLNNDDHERLGFGLAYQENLTAPPLTQRWPAWRLKPAWLAVARTRELLADVSAVEELEIRDVTPGRTRAFVLRRENPGRTVVVAWRNEVSGELNLDPAGVAVEAAHDLFGAPVPADAGWVAIGPVPTVFTVTPLGDKPAWNLARVREPGQDPAWPQRVLAAFAPADGEAWRYTQEGGAPATLAGTEFGGRRRRFRGVRFAEGGRESFVVTAPPGSGLVLRKRFLLDQAGHTARMRLGDRELGTWDLSRTAPELSDGIRESVYLLPASLLGDEPQVIELVYDSPANTVSWTVLAYDGGPLPLGAIGAVHVDSAVAPPRYGRNVVGLPLRLGDRQYDEGIGAFANALVECALNGQFTRFTAEVGIDAATKGRGTVVFNIYGDGQRLWTSGLRSGLDEVLPVEVDVTGVERLRLVLDDAGDGNAFDAGNWLNPALHP